MDWLPEDHNIQAIIIGIFFGLLARMLLLQTDYRQYPTYPHGRIVHLSLGVIAAGLGALAVPSLFARDYTAFTFLALAAQQFRDVRKMERETLSKIDSVELVPRGAAYIEGIAVVFEGRNYLVIFTAMLASLSTLLFGWFWGVVVGILFNVLVKLLKSGKTVSHIADVQPAPVRMDGPNLYVGDIYIMNIGLKDSQALIEKHGLGLILVPKNFNGRVTLANVGQRQALLHDLSTILGVYRDTSEPSLIPMAKLDKEDGRLAIFILPQDKDAGKAVRIAQQTPILESAIRMPTEVKWKGMERS
jgi:hypothetical protein